MPKKVRKKVYEGLPQVEVYKPNLDAFYKFMYDRHMIYVKRFQQQQPPPWTDNKILRDYKFTNVYRELDRGTLWYMNNVVALDGIAVYETAERTLKELLWFTTMYRLLNRVETFQEVGLPNFVSWREMRFLWKGYLEKLWEVASVFTNAHLTLPTRGNQTKIDKYICVLDELHDNVEGLSYSIEHCKSAEGIFLLLKEIPCVGNFIAYEIFCDLILARAIPFTENDFVNPGPGCKTGLRLIFPKDSTREDFQERIRELQRDQEKHFRRIGLKFPYLYPGKTLTLRSIEHSLCEFSKYRKMTTGIGKQRMKFQPQDWDSPRGQIAMRFPRS